MAQGEMEPDWAVFGGQFSDVGPTVGKRSNQISQLPLVSKEELQRIELNRLDPDRRFHYRFKAADLAWAAALFMPNNSDETAQVLGLAGSWIKVLDPDAADQFYKSLVRRCRQTEMGCVADKKRWFPQLDENGNLLDEIKPEPGHEEIPQNSDFARPEPVNPNEAPVVDSGPPPQN